MSTNLYYKVHSTSGADKGEIYAACTYVSDALFILRRWPGRASVIKFQGRIVWNNDVKKDGWMMDNADWFDASQKLIKERMELHRKQQVEKYEATLAKVQNWAKGKQPDFITSDGRHGDIKLTSKRDSLAGMGDSTMGLVMG